MCNQIATHITNILNHFCDLEVKLKTENRIFQNLYFEMKNRFLQKHVQIQKQDIETLFEAQSVWIKSNMKDIISMFLILNPKPVK